VELEPKDVEATKYAVCTAAEFLANRTHMAMANTFQPPIINL